MVSKASDDLPEPLSPVITVKVLRGISTEMFFKLCWRAPRTVMLLIAMDLMSLVSEKLRTTPSKQGEILTGGPRRVNTQLYSVSYLPRLRLVNFCASTRKNSGFNLMTSVICGFYDQKDMMRYQGCSGGGNADI